MTMTIDAPASRKEKVMLERRMAATAEPETTSVPVLPAVEQEPTVVVNEKTDLEQSVEPVADTTAEAITEPSLPADDDDDDADVFPETKPRTGGLPMVEFKPVQKDMASEPVPYAPPMSASSFFDDDDDDDELGVDQSAIRTRPMTDEELEAFDRELDAKNALLKTAREAEEKARKEQQAKAEAKRTARIEKRGSRRTLGIIMMLAGAVGILCGAAVPFIPGM